MKNQKTFVFEYPNKSDSNLATGLFSLIAFLIALAGFIIFLIFAFKINIKYIWIADTLGVISIILGPYTYFKKKYRYFALTEHYIIIMRSIIKMIPRSYIMDLSEISEVAISGSGLVQFRDSGGKIAGKLNRAIMEPEDLKNYLNILSEKNDNLKIKF
jgi:hypothetical protein